MDIINLLYLIVGSIYGLLLFLRPKIATYLLILLCVFQLGWFTRYFGASDYFGRILYFVAMLLASRIIMDFALRKIAIKPDDKMTKPILIFLVGFSALTVFSTTYNQESMVLGFYELRYYLVMTVLYFGIYYYKVLKLSQEDFIRSLVFIGFLQIPFAIIQFAMAGGGAYRTLDSVTGTFSSYGPLVLCVILSIGLLLNHKLETGKNLFKFNSYYLILVLIIPLLLSNSRTGTGLVLFIIVFVFMWASIRKTSKINPAKGIILMSILTFIAGLLFYTFFWKTSYDLKTYFSIDYVTSYYMRGARVMGTGKTGEMGRARAVFEASKLISNNTATLLIGRGGGSVVEARLLNMHGRYYFKIGPLVGIGRTQVSKIIAENGIIGIFLFIFLFYLPWKNIKRTNINKKSLQSNYIVFLVSILLLSLYMTSLESPFAVLLLSYFFALIQGQMKKPQEAKLLK